MPSKKILVVEDNLVNQEVVKETFELFGLKAQYATSGEEAVTLCGESSFDLVFMDISLPGIDGLEAARRIRTQAIAKSERPPVFVGLSAWISKPDEAGADWAVMDDVLTKPYSISQMGLILEKYAGHQQTVEEIAVRLRVTRESAKLVLEDFFSATAPQVLLDLGKAFDSGQFAEAEASARKLCRALENLGLARCQEEATDLLRCLSLESASESREALQRLGLALASTFDRLIGPRPS